MTNEVKPRVSKRVLKRDGRPLDRLIFHYETEKRLARRLLESSRDERSTLYGEVYDEYSRLCPDRKTLQMAKDPRHAIARANKEIGTIQPYLTKDMTFLEIGAGAGYLTKVVSEHVERCIAIDVSAEAAKNTAFGENVEFRITDGFHLPLEDNSIDFAYSNQMIEHLHPDDAKDQLREVFRVLKPNGRFLCISPNGLTGPHDISKFFDDMATGLHLKEYTLGEFGELLSQAGYRRVHRALIGRSSHIGTFPMRPFVLHEQVVRFLRVPGWRLWNRIVCRNLLTRAVLQVSVIATK